MLQIYDRIGKKQASIEPQSEIVSQITAAEKLHKGKESEGDRKSAGGVSP